MTLYFAYGSNMNRAFMRRLCPDAAALGVASLKGWRFCIAVAGYASIAPQPGAVVHGVLWRLSPRDRAVLDAYEDIDSGYYRRRNLPVRHGARIVPALVYVRAGNGEGCARAAYWQSIMEAAHDWQLPQPYVMELARRMPARPYTVRRGRAEKIRERA
ncbi:MAG: gamma-glutamylcyclotransferase family protein [Xanthobacteraceae bacterium]